MGVAFALSGWFAIIFGAVILARPAKIWVQLTILVNLLFIGTWALSRTVGLPAFTGDAGVEKASSIDIMCVAFEAMLIVGCIALLARTRHAARPQAGGPRRGRHRAGRHPRRHHHRDGLARRSPTTATATRSRPAVPWTTPTGPWTTRGRHGPRRQRGHGPQPRQRPRAAGAGRLALRLGPEHRRRSGSRTRRRRRDPPAATATTATSSSTRRAPASGQGNSMGVQAWSPLTDKAQCEQLSADIATMEAIAEKYPTAQDAKARRLHPGHDLRDGHRRALRLPQELGQQARHQQPRDAPLRRQSARGRRSSG